MKEREGEIERSAKRRMEMDPIVMNFLSSLRFGELKSYNNMAVFPLFSSVNESPKYVTLREVLQKRLLTITEVSESGSVPELKVVNRAEIPVLLLDGEELAGAKQNRVLNTTILVRENSETIIPVSCTEQGRWAYESREFGDSGNIMHRNVRAQKLSSVSDSLRRSRSYRSDQGAVWEGISHFSMAMNIQSPTGAMKDLFEAKQNDLQGYVDAFPYISGQKGIFVMVNGVAAGFDILSLSSACEALHQKLLKSYAIDALLQKSRATEIPSPDKARAFIEEASRCEGRRYESVGLGWDYRFEGKGIVGSSLVYQDKVIHMAFFKIDESERVGRIASSSRRRRFRL